MIWGFIFAFIGVILAVGTAFCIYDTIDGGGIEGGVGAFFVGAAALFFGVLGVLMMAGV